MILLRKRLIEKVMIGAIFIFYTIFLFVLSTFVLFVISISHLFLLGVFLREKKSESSLRDSITNGSSPSQARNSPHDCVQLLHNSPSMPQNHQENCSPVKSSRSNKPPFEYLSSFHKGTNLMKG